MKEKKQQLEEMYSGESDEKKKKEIKKMLDQMKAIKGEEDKKIDRWSYIKKP